METGEEIIVMQYDIYWYTGKCISVEVTVPEEVSFELAFEG